MTNNNTNNTMDFKKEEFRKYLEKSGVLDSLTKVLVGLYEEPERPANALDYMKRYLGAPAGVDVDGLKETVDGLRRENEELKRQLSQAKRQLAERKD